MRKIALTLMISLAGCASSRVVPIGPDTFMIQRQGGTGFSDVGGLKMDAIEGAGAYCAKDGKHLSIVSVEAVPSRGMGQYPQADVQFRCLKTGDPDLKRTSLERAPEQKIVIQNQ